MINFIAILRCATLYLLNGALAATTVSFTASEGYTRGGLKNQLEWRGSGLGFEVNPSGTGQLSIANDESWKPVWYQDSSLEAGSETYEVTIEFTFARQQAISLRGNGTVISLELNHGPNPKKTVVALRISRWMKEARKYQLSLRAKNNGETSIHFSKIFDEKRLGFSNTNGSLSDNLTLHLLLKRESSSWIAECYVKNKNADKVIGRFFVRPFGDPSWFTESVYPVISSADDFPRTLVTNRTISRFIASSEGGDEGEGSSKTTNSPTPFPTTASPRPTIRPTTASPKQGRGLKNPNVLFLAIDDLNDWVGLWGGHPDALTPNLDRLARMGLRFTNAHCSVPACNPSRASLLSGMRPSTTGLYLNKQKWKDNERLVRSVTLPEHFSSHGYYTAETGKIFHGSPIKQVFTNKARNYVKPLNYNKVSLNGLNASMFDWGPVDYPKERLGDWRKAEYTIKKMADNPEKPFFLACGFDLPHLPWYVPQEYFDRFPLKDIDLPVVRQGDLNDIPGAGKKIAYFKRDHEKILLKDGLWRKGVQAYLAATAFMDECLGQILDALDNHPEKDNTIIVLWSDHGWHLGEKMHWRKWALWEEATRVPLIFVVPGMTTPNTKSQAPVSLLDIFPTLLNVSGLPPDPNAEGNSLVPLLENWKASWKHVAVTEHGYKNRAVRTYRWRYILYADGSEELYDHRNDPNEWTNLAKQTKYDTVRKKLRKKLPNSYVKPPEKFMGTNRQ